MALEARPVGFFTDTSLCIGCKACEVACKEWNELAGNPPEFTADGYDNTVRLDAQNWRHVRFVERIPENDGYIPAPTGGGQAWLILADVCKHCRQASCAEVCPTNAIVRTEFDTVFIQQSVCNGCRACIAACPYAAIGYDATTGTARKCTLCYDRLQNGMGPACAKACPTEAIRFGYLDDLHRAADARLTAVRTAGYTQARLYGRDSSVYGGLNAFFLIMDTPHTYRLPDATNATLPSRNNWPGYLGGAVTAALGLIGGVLAFRSARMSGGEKH